jgi:hypothetical protein
VPSTTAIEVFALRLKHCSINALSNMHMYSVSINVYV